MRFNVCVVASLLLGACGKGPADQSPGEGSERVVARVGTKILYPRDLAGLLPANVSKTDSADLSRRYTEAWVKKELMLNEARNKAQLDESEIEKKVEDYRYSLTLYEFERQYLREKLDTLLPKPVLEQYYRDNITTFVLKQTIVQAFFVKMAKTNAQLGRAKILFNAADGKSKKELALLCARFAEQYHLDDSTWVDFEKLVSGTPWMDLSDKSQFVRQTTRVETTDPDFTYLLRIRQARTAGQTAPLDFAEDQIRSMVLNQRKVQLVKELEKNVYERAKTNREFQIY
ncbi:MAG: hypothetical protein H7Z75_00260 [Ferruginibacter sp.]|nr:hypothetical protein [Cytophagales bacterium]